MDHLTKKLLCEFSTNEMITDGIFLQNEKMMAMAQKKWTYVYDNTGMELHCLKQFNNVTKLHYLPHHFLLTSINQTSEFVMTRALFRNYSRVNFVGHFWKKFTVPALIYNTHIISIVVHTYTLINVMNTIICTFISKFQLLSYYEKFSFFYSDATFKNSKT